MNISTNTRLYKFGDIKQLVGKIKVKYKFAFTLLYFEYVARFFISYRIHILLDFLISIIHPRSNDKLLLNLTNSSIERFYVI